MISYPNQRVIIVHRAKKNERSFIQLDKDVSAMALAQLSYPEFKLWFYLCGNIDNYHLALSPADMEEKVALARSSYYKAFSGLLDKGYLALAQGNLYHFYERPVSVRDSSVDNSVSARVSTVDTTVSGVDSSVESDSAKISAGDSTVESDKPDSALSGF